jgi:DNA-directed RNA polymerase subunit RPC12/RpoP
MRIELEEDCPKCGEALGAFIDELGYKAYRSSEGFRCPSCGAWLLLKRSRLFMIPVFFVLWPVFLMFHALCDKLQVMCTPAQGNLEALSSFCLIAFTVLFFTQCLKVKGT